MKTILQSSVITAMAFYVTTLAAPGFVVSGNYLTFLIAAVTFVIVTAILRPLFSLFVFPFAFLSGIIVIILSNVVGLYIVALLYQSIKIAPFLLETENILGQNYHVGSLLSYFIISVIIALIIKGLEWVFDLN